MGQSNRSQQSIVTRRTMPGLAGGAGGRGSAGTPRPGGDPAPPVADQQAFAELHAKHWPEVTVVATLRQVSEGPEATDD